MTSQTIAMLFGIPPTFSIFTLTTFGTFMMAEKPFQFDPGIVFIYYIVYFTPKFIADEIDKIILILNAFTNVHSKPKILFWNQFATLDVTVWGMLPFLTNYTLDWNCHCTRYKIGTNKSRDVYTSLIKVRRQ